MRLHLLGVNGPYPQSNGANSGYLLEAGDALFQFDFGAGVLARLTALAPPESLRAIFLSHWHFDHTSDLLPLIYRLQAEGKTLPVYAPVDEHSAIRRIVQEAPSHLVIGGSLMMEIGYDQAEAVSDMMKEQGYYDVTVSRDYGGNCRVVHGIRSMHQ